MLQLKSVLCPIDFSDLSRQEIALAVEVCRAFGSRLILHHNRSAAQEWDPKEREEPVDDPAAQDKLKSVLADLPEDIPKEASVSAGPLARVLMELVRNLPADLLVLGSHGWSTRERAAITERVVEESPCAVLTVHDAVPAQRFTLRPGKVDVMVATDLTETGAHAMAYAFALARRLPMHVHVLHVAAHGANATILDTLLQQLYGLLPADLVAVAPLAARTGDEDPRLRTAAATSGVSTVECYVRRGDPIEEILLFGEHLDPTFLVMGEHAHSFFRRHFTRDSAAEVLNQAPWPVWFVPAHES